MKIIYKYRSSALTKMEVVKYKIKENLRYNRI
jgi:hypothetical protein